jgi:Leucine-rich repeat (LRR) protein
MFYCRILDLSFNRISKIENIGHLVKLRRLFLVQNKISKIENLSTLVNLEMLELGSNRIRVSLTWVNEQFFIVFTIEILVGNVNEIAVIYAATREFRGADQPAKFVCGQEQDYKARGSVNTH